MKIYVLLTTCPFMDSSSSDRINELNTYRVLSEFADVYYNNQLMDFTDLQYYGTNPNAVLEVPGKDYDLYYVRNNKSIFHIIEGKKIYFCVPNHQTAFKSADAIAYITEPWMDGVNRSDMTDYFKGIYSKDDYIPKGKVLFNQIAYPEDTKKHKITLKYRKLYNADFIIGHFGRLYKQDYPHLFMGLFDDLIKNNPDIKIKLILAGRQLVKLEHPNAEIIQNVPLKLMKYATSACDLIINEYKTNGNNFGGSLRSLDCLSTGTPMLLEKADARLLEFGEDYELYYSDDVELQAKIQAMIDDKEKLKEIGDKLRKRAEWFNVENSAIRYKQQIYLL